MSCVAPCWRILSIPREPRTTAQCSLPAYFQILKRDGRGAIFARVHASQNHYGYVVGVVGHVIHMIFAYVRACEHLEALGSWSLAVTTAHMRSCVCTVSAPCALRHTPCRRMYRHRAATWAPTCARFAPGRALWAQGDPRVWATPGPHLRVHLEQPGGLKRCGRCDPGIAVCIIRAIELPWLACL